MKILRTSLCMAVLVAGAGCDSRPAYDADANATGHTAATQATAKANAAVADALPLEDQRDFTDARRGLIAAAPELRISNDDGRMIWNTAAYGFIDGPAPTSVNPSLWRQARLNNIHGLFKVSDGIYQLRGFDLSNMTLIEGARGWIVVDPLTAKETASAAIAFARQHLGDKPVTAIIFTHSHVDHFGGVLGVLSAEQIAAQNIPVIAPQHFVEEATSENIIAGVAMGRRATYMYGQNLARDERGHVGSGLGKSPAFGTFGIVAPTRYVSKTPQEMQIDGVNFIFQNTPESEAPAEMTFYLPDLKAFCGAEVVSRNMHNLYTLRGAKVRDALKWSNYIAEAIEMFGQSEVYFSSHHWPLWGNADVVQFLKIQRDIYKYIHDQTLRLANSGLTPDEIAEQISLPESLRTAFPVRGYYGTLKHNAKAVYQRYFGWYDGNPASLDALPPVESGARYVAAMGGATAVLNTAQEAYEEGEYRWAAELLNHLVFAEPDNNDAKAALARNYDQLAYQAESGPWRDVYLTGAYELRHGGPTTSISLANAIDFLRHTPLPRFFDSMAARLNGPDADGVDLTVNMVFTDLDESYVLQIENAVLHHRLGAPDPNANATLSLTRELYLRMAIGDIGMKDAFFSDDLDIDGSRVELLKFFALFDQPAGTFNIVTP